MMMLNSVWRPVLMAFISVNKTDPYNKHGTRLGPEAIIGVTCHDSLALAETARANGASYVAFGAMFVSTTKPGAAPATLQTLTKARQLRLPVVAIGGISADNAASVIAAGADCVAVISDLWTANDIAARARVIAQLF
jgi:thiamine-phosphate pyrophosphorylase